MSKQTEALKLALEALKELRMLGMNAQWHDSWLAKPNEVITAIREALAEQPAQQELTNIERHERNLQKFLAETSQQEPVAWIDMSQWPPIRWRDGMIRKDVDQFDGQGLYTSPPAQRKPLTDEEIMEMYNEPRSDAEMLEFARAIEAKLREKNA